MTAAGWSAWGTWIGAGAACVAIYYAGTQIDSAGKALQATTIYNIEKDYSELFSKQIDEKFRNCFGKGNLAGSSQAPAICSDERSRQTFFAVLDFYRLLLDLANNNAIPKQYVATRIGGFCPYFVSGGGSFMLAEWRNRSFIRPDLDQRIKSECGG